MGGAYVSHRNFAHRPDGTVDEDIDIRSAIADARMTPEQALNVPGPQRLIAFAVVSVIVLFAIIALLAD